MKRFLVSLICIITAVVMILGCSFGTYAAPSFVVEGFGTEEEGIIPPISFYPHYHTPYTETNGFPNADFEKGLMYWSQGRKLNPADVVDIVEEENGNKYLTFTCDAPYQGIDSVRFVDSRVKVGDNLVVVYDWRGEDPNFQVALVQYMMNADGSSGTEVRLSHNGDAKRCDFLFTTEEKGWNVSFNKVQNPVAKPSRGDDTIYLSYMVQVCNDPTNTSHIDNIRLAIYGETANVLYDLDGNVMYDLNNLPTDNTEDEIDSSEFDDIDFDAENEDLSENEETTADTDDESEDKTFIKKYLLWIIIGAGAVVIIAAAVVVIIVIAAKKKKNTASEDTQAETETQTDTE